MGFNLIMHPDCEHALESQSSAEVREGLIVHRHIPDVVCALLRRPCGVGSGLSR